VTPGRVYDRREHGADFCVHIAGIAFGVIAAAALIATTQITQNTARFPVILVYLLGLWCMLGFSAAYNLTPPSSVKDILRRLDHSAIFLLIAATYTPFLTIGMEARSISILALIWAAASLGVVLKVFLPGRLERIGLALYLMLGWSGVLAYAWTDLQLKSTTLILIAIGGAIYSLGTVFHLWNSLRFQNAIWHAHVLLAAAFHAGAVFASLTT
jgi:hemolysin III